MKRKVLLSVLAIFLILALSGCWQPYPGYDPYWVPEDDIIELVNYYWYCISQGTGSGYTEDWEGWYWCAQNLCCVPYGDTWYQVEEYQNTPHPEGTVITYDPYYNWIRIDGDEAIANIDLVITTCLEDVCSTETIYHYSMYLIKTVNWNLK